MLPPVQPRPLSAQLVVQLADDLPSWPALLEKNIVGRLKAEPLASVTADPQAPGPSSARRRCPTATSAGARAATRWSRCRSPSRRASATGTTCGHARWTRPAAAHDRAQRPGAPPRAAARRARRGDRARARPRLVHPRTRGRGLRARIRGVLRRRRVRRRRQRHRCARARAARARRSAPGDEVATDGERRDVRDDGDPRRGRDARLRRDRRGDAADGPRRARRGGSVRARAR